MPIIGPNPGRGRGPLEPQLYYAPQQLIPGVPFVQTDWPLPQGHQAQAQWRDYTFVADWTPRFQFPAPDTTKIFRGHLRSLPAQPYPPNFFQSWTQSFFIPRLPLPAGDQVTDLPPAQRVPEQIQLHSWTASYNLNLIGRDRLPTGDQVYDLAPGQRLPEQIQLHSWTWNYNLNLIGKDRMTVGEQVYDLTISQRLPADAARTWVSNLNTTTLFPAITKPFNQYDWQLPQGHQAQQQRDFTFVSDWTPRFAFPPPDNTKIFRPHQRSLPDQPAPPLLQQAVFQAYPPLHPTAVGPLGVVFNQFDWPVPKAPQQPAPSLTASYNPNLVGQDKLPTGEQISDLTPRDYQRLFQTWITNVSQALTPPPPIRQRDWPLPRGYEPDWRRDWEWWYNLNLIAQDRFPPGEQSYDLEPRDFQRLFQTWIQSVNLALFVQPLPPNQYDWPTPKAPQQPALSWTASYNPNLIGQDQLPPGAKSYELAPRDYQRGLQSWIQNTNLALLTTPPQLPLTTFAQYDWPVPRPYPPAPPSWTASYNQNLIGQDQLPSGKPITDLPPRDVSRTLQTWITNVSLALTAPTLPLTAFNQYDWPLPQAPRPPVIDNNQQNLTARLPPPAPSTQLHQNPFFITMGRLSQLGNLPS